MREIVLHMDTFRLYSVMTALICLIAILITPKLFPKVPGHLVGSNFFDHTGEAINHAMLQMDAKKCFGCKHFAFHECDQLSQQTIKKEAF